MDNPRRRSSFGFASEAFEVLASGSFRHALLTVPVDAKLAQDKVIDPATLRLFQWDEQRRAFLLVPSSAITADWQEVTAHITRPGIYAVIGLSANPWLRETIAMFRRFAPLLRVPQLRKRLKERICHFILCPGIDFQNIIEQRGGLEKMGLPDFPRGFGGNICQICLDIDLPDDGLPEGALLDEVSRGAGPCLDIFFDLDGWLTTQSAIANAIVWREPSTTGPVNGTPKPYPAWSSSQKAELAQVFWMIWQGGSPGLAAAPPIIPNLSTNGDLFAANLDPAAAWQYFLGYVAQSLAVEIAGWVPWSILSYSPSELEWLFDSHSLFEYSSTLDKYVVLMRHGSLVDHGAAMPGDPVRTFGFLKTASILGSTPRETIASMLDWCRANLVHFYGGWDQANLQAHWQYAGWPPVESIIAGTTHPQHGFAHWTGGCWGTTGFLRAVLRTANIPVNLEERCDHALPHFLHESLYLSHGDDLYSWFAKATPPIPADELLIDQATFDQWFGASVPAPTVCNNVGRRIRDLAIQYLPNFLLRMHCADIAAGKDHAQSDVFNQSGFSLNHTVADLEAADLWGRMDAKIAAFGGCANVPT